ncbi:MAG: serine/threonine protein kinase [Actinobacteria bacterium]|nr:serine/threonine protein kinase [Actinomycetota bacterium]
MSKMAEPPLFFDRYRLVERLGRGAYATVYLAEDTRMGRLVAVKVIEDSVDVDGRGLREAQAAAKLNHPHVVTVHEVLRRDDRTYLIAEFVDGHTLREAYSRRLLSDAEVVQVGVQTCRALEHAHRRGVVHRDIKPENMMLTADEEVDVRIMDFGVARLEDAGSVTQEGELIGTLAYMAPEQAEGREAGPKADIFALGLVLYEGLTGSNPLRGRSVPDLVGGKLQRSIPPLREARPDVPTPLVEAVEAALSPDEEIRPDAGTLRRMLQTAAKTLPEPQAEATLVQKTVAMFVEEDTRGRMVFIGRRLLSGSLIVGALAYLLPRVPLYPPSAVVYLVASSAFVGLLWPFGGSAAALALLTPCVFAFSSGWGWLFLLAVAPSFAVLSWRGYAWASLLPFLAPVLCGAAGRGVGGLGGVLLAGFALALPYVAGMLVRFWGPLLGFFCGLAVALAAGFQGWPKLPFAFSPGGEAVLETTRYQSSVGEVATVLARFLDSRTELGVQILVMMVFALPLRSLLQGPPARRMWVASGYVGALGLAVLMFPVLVSRAESVPWLSGVALIPCVIIVVLSSALFPARGLDV